MKRISLKKALSVFLTGAVLLGFTACDFGGAGKKAVIEAADTLASDMASASASKMIKNSTLDKKCEEGNMVFYVIFVVCFLWIIFQYSIFFFLGCLQRFKLSNAQMAVDFSTISTSNN